MGDYSEILWSFSPSATPIPLPMLRNIQRPDFKVCLLVQWMWSVQITRTHKCIIIPADLPSHVRGRVETFEVVWKPSRLCGNLRGRVKPSRWCARSSCTRPRRLWLLSMGKWILGEDQGRVQDDLAHNRVLPLRNIHNLMDNIHNLMDNIHNLRGRVHDDLAHDLEGFHN